MPRTRFGKWSVSLIGASVAFFAIAMLLVMAGQRGGDTLFDNLWLAVPMLLAGASAIGAFFVGILGVIRQKDRSVLVMATIVIGLLVIIFILGEIIIPH